jgi:hypothetical protein
MVFDARANGDAVLIVAGVYLVWALFFWLSTGGLPGLRGVGSNINLVLSLFVNGAFAWILATGAMWLVGTYVLEGSGRFGTALPVTGFAHAPLVLVPILVLVGLSGAMASLIAGAWSFAVLTVGSQVALELPRERAALAALAGVVVWWILFFVF